MLTVAPEPSPPGSTIFLENLLLGYPEGAQGAVILCSQDSYEFRIPRHYIISSSPILSEKTLISPNPQLGASAISAGSDVECSVVQLSVNGIILFSLLSYISPVPPILPSTADQIMELLSIAHMYKMDIVLTHIRSHITQQRPPFIQKETAFSVYALAQKYGLRTEALQAARCTLSFSSMAIQNLAKDDKLSLMPGTCLHELWRYHQKVGSSLRSDIKNSKIDEPKFLKSGRCESVINHRDLGSIATSATWKNLLFPPPSISPTSTWSSWSIVRGGTRNWVRSVNLAQVYPKRTYALFGKIWWLLFRVV